MRHPKVRAAAVGADADPVGGGQRLAAWLVPSGDLLDVAELRSWLVERLPPYLVPSVFAVIDELPSTPSGKLNRRALAAQPAQRLVPTPPAEAPQTTTEVLVAEAWKRVLGVPSVGRRHHFFELGGHSLLATRAINAIRAATGHDVSLRSLFEHPVLSEFAAAVDAAAGMVVSAVVPVDRSGPVPLSFAQQRLWLLHLLEPAGTEYAVAFAAQFTGQLDRAALRDALSEVVARHEVLRTTFGVVDGEPVQVVHDPAPVDLPVVEVSDVDAAATLVARDAARPFDLAVGPLLRARLLRVGDGEHVLSLVLHHVVSDVCGVCGG